MRANLVRILVTVNLVVSASAAFAGSSRLALRGGAILEGPQHTLTEGVLFGAAWDEPRAWGSTGVAVEWAENTAATGSVSLAHLALYARRELGTRAIRPFLEGGAGVGLLHWDLEHAGGKPEDHRDLCAVGWLGVGAARRLSARVDLRVDGRYVAFGSEPPTVEGFQGDLGDHFSVSGSLAIGR